jgi:tetratricopeptide (TPR) repeat protein
MNRQSDTAVQTTAPQIARFRSTITVFDPFADGPSTRRTIRHGLLRTSTWVRQVGVLILVFTAYPLLAQMTPQQRLMEALTLEREARPAQAIVELLALLDSKSLDAAGIGKAWNILGLAFEDQGNFLAARHAYEQSIHTFKGLPNYSRDYAMALDDLGGLYVATGQLDLAARLRVKALHLYDRANDHAGIARGSSDLAGIAFNQKKVNQGRRYLEQALKEARLANNLDEDDHAALASMRGWLAQFDGDVGTAVSSYQQSLDLWRSRHGEEHPFTGWGYTLLGKAHAETGNLTIALAEMRRGLGILGRTLNHQDSRYLTAEIAYSRVLDKTGAHSEATQIKTDAERQLREFYSRQCVDCTISVATFH